MMGSYKNKAKRQPKKERKAQFKWQQHLRFNNNNPYKLLIIISNDWYKKWGCENFIPRRDYIIEYVVINNNNEAINECEKILNAEENKNNNSNSNSSIINNNNISISKDSNSNNNKNRSKKLFKTIIVAATHSDKLNNIQFDSSNINDLVHVLPLCKILCKLTNHINLQSCWTGHNIQKIANECYKINRNIAMSGFDAEIDDHRTLIQWIQTGALLVKPTDKMLHDYLYHFVYGING